MCLPGWERARSHPPSIGGSPQIVLHGMPGTDSAPVGCCPAAALRRSRRGRGGSAQRDRALSPGSRRLRSALASRTAGRSRGPGHRTAIFSSRRSSRGSSVIMAYKPLWGVSAELSPGAGMMAAVPEPASDESAFPGFSFTICKRWDGPRFVNPAFRRTQRREETRIALAQQPVQVCGILPGPPGSVSGPPDSLASSHLKSPCFVPGRPVRPP
jgi:hypothetical protein